MPMVFSDQIVLHPSVPHFPTCRDVFVCRERKEDTFRVNNLQVSRQARDLSQSFIKEELKEVTGIKYVYHIFLLYEK
jgi:hypothetical protein